MSLIEAAPQAPSRPTKPRTLSDYEPAMRPETAWPAMNTARAVDPRANVYGAVEWSGGAVRRGIVFG